MYRLRYSAVVGFTASLQLLRYEADTGFYRCAGWPRKGFYLFLDKKVAKTELFSELMNANKNINNL